MVWGDERVMVEELHGIRDLFGDQSDSWGLTWYEGALANPSRQFRNPCHLLGTYQPSDVNWVGLDLLEISGNVEILNLNSFLLRLSSEGEEVAAVGIGIRCIRRIVTIVQNILQLSFIPARKVITVKILFDIKIAVSSIWQMSVCLFVCLFYGKYFYLEINTK